MLCMILVGMNRCLHASHGKDKGAISRDVAQTECVNLRVNQAFTASIRQSRPYLLSKIHGVTYGLLRLGTYLQCLRADLRSIMAAPYGSYIGRLVVVSMSLILSALC